MGVLDCDRAEYAWDPDVGDPSCGRIWAQGTEKGLKSSVLAVIRAGWGGEGSVELLVWAEAGDASWLEEIDVGVGRVLALLYLAAGNNVSVPHPLAV
ncbi:hypothetical protein MMC34_007850 [Xylographa carneopallida]|nr:hypothetical protein [Xylographa carneopallida]